MRKPQGARCSARLAPRFYVSCACARTRQQVTSLVSLLLLAALVLMTRAWGGRAGPTAGAAPPWACARASPLAMVGRANRTQTAGTRRIGQCVGCAAGTTGWPTTWPPVGSGRPPPTSDDAPTGLARSPPSKTLLKKHGGLGGAASSEAHEGARPVPATTTARRGSEPRATTAPAFDSEGGGPVKVGATRNRIPPVTGKPPTADPAAGAPVRQLHALAGTTHTSYETVSGRDPRRGDGSHLGAKSPAAGHAAGAHRPTASCCHRRDTHIACARNRNRPSRAIRISGFGRSGATSVGRSSVQRRPPVGHKAPCSRPCCLGTRLASPSWALACTGGMACHWCTSLAPPLCARASSPAARAGGVLLSSWLLGRKASLLAASS